MSNYMSNYLSKNKYRITLNNPEKVVPDYIVQQFFMKIKAADIDGIRDFALKYKNKYNLIEKIAKRSPSDSFKNPFHIVLELDEKIADDNAKLRLMEYLDMMGAPLDLPDIDNVWPIHLAASLQSEKIIDWMIGKKVSLIPKDSSNNTALHYAIIGKEINCPQVVKVGALTPLPKTDQIEFNTTLTEANMVLASILNNRVEISDTLVHMINTISKIPEMYVGDPLNNTIETDIINILTEISLDPTYAPGPTDSKFGRIDQLVNKTYNTVRDELLQTFLSPLTIKPNAGGWGPSLPERGPTLLAKNPTPTEKILDDIATIYQLEIRDKYIESINKIATASDIDKLVMQDIPQTISMVKSQYLNTLIFCPQCKKLSFGYGEETTYIQMLYLLSLNHYIINYASYFADKLLQTYKLMDNIFYKQIYQEVYGLNRKMWGAPGPYASNKQFYLFGAQISFLIGQNNFDLVRSDPDVAIYNLLQTTNYKINEDSIRDLLKLQLFTNIDNQHRMVYKIKYRPRGPDTVGNLAKNSNISINQYILKSVDPNDTLLAALSEFIKNIKPVPSRASDNIFRTDYYNLILGAGFGLQPGQYILPYTPLPPITLTRQPSRKNPPNYTFYELFRIFQMLTEFMTRGDFVTHDYPMPYGGNYPIIFDEIIGNWENYVNRIGQSALHNRPSRTINDTYPEFIFLYKIFVDWAKSEIKQIIEKSINTVINNALTDNSTDPNIIHFKSIFSPITDAYILGLLVPNLSGNDLELSSDKTLNMAKSRVWDRNNQLVQQFDNFAKKIPNTFISDVSVLFLHMAQNFVINPIDNLAAVDPANLGYNRLNNIRDQIYRDVPNRMANIQNILALDNFELSNQIIQYLDSKIPNNNMPIQSSSQSFINMYNNLPFFNINDNYQQLVTMLRNNQIDPLFFLTNVYAYYFYNIANRFNNLLAMINTVYPIINDINLFIQNKYYYYVAQIFLPALIKIVVQSIKLLVDLRDDINKFNEKKNDFSPLIGFSTRETSQIIILGNEFNESFDDKTESIYENILRLVDYHNDVITHLNIVSASQLVNSVGTVDKIFTMNLVQLKTLPRNLESFAQTNNLNTMLESYQSPKIHYYHDEPDLSPNLSPNLSMVFGPNINTGMPSPNDTYRNIIKYLRNSTDIANISNSPVNGSNYQINIINDQIQPIDKDIDGQWLVFDGTTTNFADAFIGYSKSLYSYDWLAGMPPSIKQFLGPHLKILKLTIIQKIIQEIVTNYYNTTPGQNVELAKLYQKMIDLGTATNSMTSVGTNIDNTKVYIVLGQILDNLINKFMEYVTKQSVMNWIRSIASKKAASDPDPRIGNQIRNILNIIVQKENQTLSLSDINKKTIDLFSNANANQDYRLAHVEPKPTNIEYSTHTTPKEFIHYLYNIDYFSNNNTSSTKKCYQINNAIIKKLITPDTINSQNSDGLTPLQLAIENNLGFNNIDRNDINRNDINQNDNNKNIIQLLIEHKAMLNFKNTRGQTVTDISILKTENHIKYTTGQTVYDTISNFVIPFNDLLLARLKDDSFNNNIVSHVTYAIPIQILMYNHLFHLYLENYRYGFTFELKQSLTNLVRKYFNNMDIITIYPFVSVYLPICPGDFLVDYSSLSPDYLADHYLAVTITISPFVIPLIVY